MVIPWYFTLEDFIKAQVRKCTGGIPARDLLCHQPPRAGPSDVTGVLLKTCFLISFQRNSFPYILHFG